MSNGYSMFGERLVERGVVMRQLEEAIHKQQTSMGHRKLVEILVRLGYIGKNPSPRRWPISLALTSSSSPSATSPNGCGAWWTAAWPRCTGSFPSGNASTLVVATADPTNINNLDNLSRLLDRPVEPVLSTQANLERAGPVLRAGRRQRGLVVVLGQQRHQHEHAEQHVERQLDGKARSAG